MCECKVVRNKSLVLREDGAEEGNIEIGGTGFLRKPERANLCERLLFRKHRYLTVLKFRIVVEAYRNRPRIVRNHGVPVCRYRAVYFGTCLYRPLSGAGTPNKNKKQKKIDFRLGLAQL